MLTLDDYVEWANELAKYNKQTYYVLKNKASMTGYDVISKYEYEIEPLRLRVVYETD